MNHDIRTGCSRCKATNDFKTKRRYEFPLSRLNSNKARINWVGKIVGNLGITVAISGKYLRSKHNNAFLSFFFFFSTFFFNLSIHLLTSKSSEKQKFIFKNYIPCGHQTCDYFHIVFVSFCSTFVYQRCFFFFLFVGWFLFCFCFIFVFLFCFVLFCFVLFCFVLFCY